jgi:hypothetical protein
MSNIVFLGLKEDRVAEAGEADQSTMEDQRGRRRNREGKACHAGFVSLQLLLKVVEHLVSGSISARISPFAPQTIPQI